MMPTSTVETMPFSDADLVRQSRAGNRDAFGRIVARYQSLVCSLAYSATGSLSRSEDLAQETFLAAWKQLPQLREPEKLRSWLCRIARNRVCEAFHRDGREPSHRAEPLEEIAESHSLEPLPADHAINREEQAILWRSLARIPELYREPLVLYYREHQSLETVARNLELSEDAVKQRLSRGRKLLQQEVLLFVEGALERTNPGKAFTLAVLGTLPAITFSAKAGTAGSLGMAVKTGAGAKTAGLAGFFGLLLGPLLMFLPNYVAYRVSLAGTCSEAERTGVRLLYGRLAGITMGLFLPVAAAILWFTRDQADYSALTGLFASILVVIFVPTIFLLTRLSARQARGYQSHLLREQYAGVLPAPQFEYRSSGCFLGLPLVHIRVGDRFNMLQPPVKAWIAIGYKAAGGLFACGSRTIAPISVGGLSCGLISFGALSFGGIAIGGIAMGIWPLFGGLIVGWQALGGYFALGWNAAVGNFACAHDYALGEHAIAVQANNHLARAAIKPHLLYQCGSWLGHHWIIVACLSMVPFLVLWWIYSRPSARLASRVSVALLAPFLAAAFLLSGCGKSGQLDQTSKFAVPSGPVPLPQHWRAGERIVKSFDLKMSSHISVPGQPIQQDMTLHEQWALNVLAENPNGSHAGEMELLQIRAQLEQGGRMIGEYDSKNPPGSTTNATAAAFRKVFADAVGARVPFLLDASNRLERIDRGALKARLAASEANGPGAGLKSLFNEGFLRQMIGDSHTLPARSVQVGDTWTVHGDLPLDELGRLASDYEYNLQSWESRGKRLCARLEFQGTLKGQADPHPDAESMSMSLQDGSVSGVSWFDPELGLMTETSLTQDLSMIMTVPVHAHGKNMMMTMTNAMHQIITIKLESVH